MKNKLSIAVKTIGILFVFALGVVSIIGSGGGGGGGTPTTTTTTLPGGASAINKDNIIDIIHGINPYASLGEDSDYLADLQITAHDCVDGGNVETTINNDTLVVTYNDCNESGTITNGIVNMTITLVLGDLAGGPPYSVKVHLVYNDLTSEDVISGLVSTSSADMDITISEDDAFNFSIMMEGGSLTQQWDNEEETLSNFQIESTYNQNTFVFTQVLNGDLDSTLIGFITFNTTETFTGKDDSGSTGNPTAGVLQITNSVDNSQARLTALPDGLNLKIEVDADGDGDYEYEDSISWADLENL